MQSHARMPVGTWISTVFVAGAVGSDATDWGGFFTIVKTNAAPARANATPNSFNLRMLISPHWIGQANSCAGDAKLLSNMAAHSTELALRSSTEQVFRLMVELGGLISRTNL